VYLKRNIVVEPLVDRWHAWSHLIPPATYARNITERHLKIMDSYIGAPEVHAAAARNPKLLGGPFMDYSRRETARVDRLRGVTRNIRTGLIALSHALAELDTLLQREARGFSLTDLYQHVPDPLRGYVELIYDLNNHPSFRIVEPLMYRSEYYQRSAQSLMLSIINGDDRPFVLSTPRLDEQTAVHIQVPFEAPTIDRLCAMKQKSDSVDDIASALEIEVDLRQVFQRFFTSEPPPPYAAYSGPGLRWRYFGHACVLVEGKGRSILFDPVLSYTYETSISRYTYDDLPPKIDYAVITHNHQDHVLFETLLQLRSRIGTVVVPANNGGRLEDPSLRLILQNCGFRSVVELREMQEITDDGGVITGIPFLGEHGDLNIASKLAYFVRWNGHRFLFAADSTNLEPRMYRHIHNWIGDVDVLFLGMECDGAPMSWLYGPLLTKPMERAMDHSRRLAGSNYQQALRLVEEFGCKEVYVYAMGQEPWLKYMMNLKYTAESNPIIQSNRLIETCRDRGIIAERLFGEKEICVPSIRYASSG